MDQIIVTLVDNAAVIIAAGLGAVVALAVDGVKKLVAKTPTKIDDDLLAKVIAAVKADLGKK